MIRYYSYYSVGGYKEMYLGNNHSTDERVYYLPLFEAERQQSKTAHDDSLYLKLERQEKLPKICILTPSQTCGLPRKAITLITHGSFSLIYSHLEDAKFIIVIRGIQADGTVPFLFSFMCDEQGDVSNMNRLASYLATNTNAAKRELTRYLHYDSQENGLCFEQKLMNLWLENILRDTSNDQVQLADGRQIRLKGEAKKTALLLVPQGVMVAYALEELSLNKMETTAFCELMIIPKDDPEEVNRRRQWWADVEYRRKVRLLKNIAIGVVAVLIVGGTLYMCTRN